MRTSAKLGAYGAILAVVFAGALGAGSVIGSPVSPVDDMQGANELHGSSSTSPAGGHGEADPPETVHSVAADSLDKSNEGHS